MNNIKIFDNHIWIDLYSPTYSVKILNTNIESMIKSENYVFKILTEYVGEYKSIHI